MATFNGARFVERQVATILEQLEPGDELVVSDDGSTDETVALVRAFADPRIRILDGNAFHSPLRNFEHAVRHAAGETIVLADQDDVWLPNKLPLVRELFAGESARPYLVVLDARIVDEDERVVYPSVQAKLHAGPGFVKNIWANRYLGCCMAFSRDLLDVALPFPAAVDMHDIWLGQLCERIGTTAFVPVTTMLYRRHDDNATGFERRFQPVQQVRRRAALVWELARRGRRRRRRRLEPSLYIACATKTESIPEPKTSQAKPARSSQSGRSAPKSVWASMSALRVTSENGPPPRPWYSGACPLRDRDVASSGLIGTVKTWRPPGRRTRRISSIPFIGSSTCSSVSEVSTRSNDASAYESAITSSSGYSA